MAFNKTSALINKVKRSTPQFEPKQPIMGEMFLPNHSGMASHPEFNKALDIGLAAFLKLDGSNQASWTPTTTKVTNLNADRLDNLHVGTSGAAVPSLAGRNTWGDIQTLVAGADVGYNPSSPNYLTIRFYGGGETGIGFTDDLNKDHVNIWANNTQKAVFTDVLNTINGDTNMGFTDFTNGMELSGGDFRTNLTASRFVKTDADKDLTVSTASTIDISSETNLAVTSPIVLTGDTLSFSFSTNNTWTGTNAFNSGITMQDTDAVTFGDSADYSIFFDGDGTAGSQGLIIQGARAVKITKSDANFNSPYELSLQTNTDYTYFEILNNGGANLGGFFGMAFNEFELWNYQGNAAGSGDYATVFYGGWGSPELLSLDRASGTAFNDSGLDIDFRIEGDTCTHMIFCDASAATENIALLAASAPNWQSMDRGIFIANATTVPTGNPSGGGFLFVESGALKFRGSSGTVTTIAVA
ncbi:MAG: hypothetical protein HC874_27350 [Richelia sp. SL_2_1]|nr:hypothetical protein [Richelia sp. SL_2_1]